MDLKECRWKVLESRYLFKRPWLTVRHEQIELPNGNLIPEYYILEYPEWVNVIAVTREKKFVFIKQYRHGIGETRYELCAGVCDPDDVSPLAAAKRELLEETGYGNGEWKLSMAISANPSTHTNMTYCFVAENVEWIAPQNLEDSEDLTVHLLSVDEVKKLLIDDQIKQSLHAAPLWRYFAENRMI